MTISGIQPSRHVFEEHVGEVQLRIEAPDLPGLFVEAGRALAELVTGARRWSAPESRERVEVRATDREALLVSWIDELIYLIEVTGRVYTEFSFERLTDGELVAEVRGAVPATLRVAVKAATYHRLRIEARPEGYAATVVLDV